MFSPLPLPDVSAAMRAPLSMTVDEGVRFHRASGRRVSLVHGRPWVEARRGYWVPVRMLEPLGKAEVRWPALTAVGFRAVARDPREATSTAPSLLVADLPSYSVARIERDRRRELRRVLVSHEFRVLDSPDLLLQQGWEMASAAAAVSGHELPATQDEYRAKVKSAFESGYPLVVAALLNDQLVGYTASHAVETDVVFDSMLIAHSARDDYVGTGLYWVSLTLWARCSQARTAWLGLRFPERRGIDAFKMSMGVELVEQPVISGLRWPARAYLKVRRPEALERLG